MTNKLLSICIPTYNRAEYLDEALASIVNQIDDTTKNYIEICVSDNASTDHTNSIIQKWIEKSPVPIIYSVNEINEGADRNFLKVIEIASGEYCWFLGSDDRVEKGAIQRNIEKILAYSQVDIFVLCQLCYNKDFSSRIIAAHHPLLNNNSDVLFNSAYECVDNVTYAFGYLSILLFRKVAWDKIDGFEKYVGTAYVHVYKLLAMIRGGAKVMFLRQESVGWRSDNDSFLAALKLFNRIKIDVDGYYRIAADVFGEHSPEHKSVVRQIINIHCIGHIMTLKGRRESISLQFEVAKLFFKYYNKFPDFWLKLVPLLCIPNDVYHLARFVYRKTLKPYRLRQINRQLQ